MEVVERGAGPPVLILGCHGPGGTWGLDALATALEREHRVLLPDLPGYGATPPLAGRYTLEAVTAALETMLRERGAARLAIVGFSLGAYPGKVSWRTRDACGRLDVHDACRAPFAADLWAPAARGVRRCRARSGGDRGRPFC